MAERDQATCSRIFAWIIGGPEWVFEDRNVFRSAHTTKGPIAKQQPQPPHPHPPQPQPRQPRHPLRLNLLGIAVGAITGFAVIHIWPEIDIFAQRLRAAAVATVGPERVYAVPDPAVTPRPAASSNSTHSTSSNTTEVSIPAIGSPSKAQAVNSQIPPIDRRLKGGLHRGSRRRHYCIGTRAPGSHRQGAPLGLHAASAVGAGVGSMCGRTGKRRRD